MNLLLRQGRSLSGREPNCCFLNLGDGHFADISTASGFDFSDDGRAVARVDWDQDGDLDLWIANRNGPQVRLLRNDVPRKHHWLALRLVGNGTTSNRDAIGARVEVGLGQGSGVEKPKSIKTLRAGDGYLSQSSKWLHFGLGSSAEIEHVTVRWPDGTVEEFAGLVADRSYRIVQGSPEAELWQGPARLPLALRSESLAGSPSTETAGVISVARLPLPLIEYETFSGRRQEVVLSKKDQPAATLVNLWASWCRPCVGELREFTSHKDRIRGAGVDIVALSVDELEGPQGSSAETVQQLIAQIGFPFRFGKADAAAIEKLQMVHDFLFDMHRPLAVPTSFLLDSEGRIIAVYRGQVSVDRLLSDVQQRPTHWDELVYHALPFPGRWHRHGKHLNPYPLMLNLLDHGYLDDVNRYVEKNAALFDQNSDFSQLRFELADKQIELGQFQAAEQNIRAGLKLNPKKAEAYYNLGGILQSKGRYRDAIRQFEQALQLGADPLHTHAILGSAYLAQDQPELAIDHLQQALKLDPDHSQVHGNLGHALAMSGDVKEATIHFQRVVELHPEDTAAHANLGKVYLAQDQPELAINHFRRVVELSPDDSQALGNLARMLAMHGSIDEATLHLKRILELQPEDVAAHDYLGNIYLSQDKRELAIHHLRRAVELNPEFLKAHQKLATTLISGGQIKEATIHFQRVVELQPNHAAARANFAAALVAQGELEAGIRHLRRAVELKPDYLKAHQYLAEVLKEAGRLEEANQHLEEVQRLQSTGSRPPEKTGE